MKQTVISIGAGTDPWHGRVTKRVRFVLEANGSRQPYVGTVKKVSPTAAFIKLREEIENDEGKPISRMVEIPTAMIDPGSIRELRPGEAA